MSDIQLFTCVRCGDVRERGRPCRSCRAAFMRRWRKTHPRMGKQRQKLRCVACGRAPRHESYRRCRACMAPIWRAAAAKASRSFKRMHQQAAK